jgi:hypothetical protein
MILYLVQSAGDLTGALGYGAAILDAEHPHVLVTFADACFRSRNSILPGPEHPSWEKSFQPPPITPKEISK